MIFLRILNKVFMIILGIDPGVQRMGYGLINHEGGKYSVLDFGLVSVGESKKHGESLFLLRGALSEIFLKFKPDLVAVEKLFFSKNIKTAMKVGEARGVVILTATESNVPIIELTPNEVKVAVAGYGRADKRQVQRMIKVLLGLGEVPKPDDVADALAVAYTGHLFKSVQK